MVSVLEELTLEWETVVWTIASQQALLGGLPKVQEAVGQRGWPRKSGRWVHSGVSEPRCQEPICQAAEPVTALGKAAHREAHCRGLKHSRDLLRLKGEWGERGERGRSGTQDGGEILGKLPQGWDKMTRGQIWNRGGNRDASSDEETEAAGPGDRSGGTRGSVLLATDLNWLRFQLMVMATYIPPEIRWRLLLKLIWRQKGEFSQTLE